jgi:hypothetical protein
MEIPHPSGGASAGEEAAGLESRTVTSLLVVRVDNCRGEQAGQGGGDNLRPDSKAEVMASMSAQKRSGYGSKNWGVGTQ